MLRRRKSFRCNTYVSPRICCKQKTYGRAKFLRCNTYKKHGGGGPILPVLELTPRQSPLHSSPLFSRTYALPILQLLSFHTHACNGGVYPPHHPGRPLVHNGQLPVQLRFPTSHESPVTRSHPPVPNCTDGRTLQRVYTPCAILPFLRSADRPFLPPWRPS